MKLVSFCILTALSLIYAGLTMMETVTYHKWEAAVNNQKYLQSQVNYFDRLNAILNEMIKRMAYFSQHDPAMAQLLKDHNINVVVENPTTPPAATTSSFDVSPAASTSDKPTQTPSTSEHP
jgi:hypothetical protein